MGDSINTNHHIFYSEDCIVLTFDQLQAQQGNLLDYSPFPSDFIYCNFLQGDVTCERLSDYKILLRVNEICPEIEGKIGQLQNPSIVSELTVQSIDYFDECWPLSTESRVSLDRATPDNILSDSDIIKVEFPSGQISLVSNLTTTNSTLQWASNNTALIEFAPATQLPQDSGIIEIISPIWIGDLYQVKDSEIVCTSFNFANIETEFLESEGKL